MLPAYKILYLFESPSLFITEIKRLNMPEGAELSEIFHWLYLDRKSGALIKLWFRSLDSSPAIEERFFEQGYLKFNTAEATFIEKYNSAQHSLDNRSNSVPAKELIASLEDYLKTHS